ncbi:MAG: hypothetical protein ACI9PP_000875 [Halobacteriales archaeon]|jgi:hypothetical protein
MLFQIRKSRHPLSPRTGPRTPNGPIFPLSMFTVRPRNSPALGRALVADPLGHRPRNGRPTILALPGRIDATGLLHEILFVSKHRTAGARMGGRRHTWEKGIRAVKRAGCPTPSSPFRSCNSRSAPVPDARYVSNVEPVRLGDTVIDERAVTGISRFPVPLLHPGGRRSYYDRTRCGPGWTPPDHARGAQRQSRHAEEHRPGFWHPRAFGSYRQFPRPRNS